MYECYNPFTKTVTRTQYMGEADFWASVGHAVFDYFFLMSNF